MSGIGTITAEEVFSERVELQPRTSDPSGTEEGEGWIRSDIAPESNQIATLRVDTGGSTIDVPILQAGTATDGVVEALRLSVGGTLGYVPAIPESKAAFPALRLQHNGQVYGWHDARGETAFFDVAIDSTNSPVEDGETLTVDYSVQNTGGSLNNTQDIRLDVGSIERDRDSNVTVASGGSTTGQLSWGSAAQGSYTASVLSDDDVASTSVSVEFALPDAQNLQYWYNPFALSASDGQTVDRPDQQGTNETLTANGSVEFDTDLLNESHRYTGGYHKGEDASDWSLLHDGSPFSIYVVVYIDTTTNGFRLVASTSVLTGDDTGFVIAHDSSSSTDALRVFVGDSSGDAIIDEIFSNEFPKQSAEILSVRFDGTDTYTINRVKSKVATPTGTGHVTSNPNSALQVGNRDDNDIPLRGNVGNLPVYNVEHSDQTHDGVVDYLATQHGITI